MANNIYPCSQEQLYETAETAWNIYLLNIGDFSKFRKAYTTKFYEDRIKEIKETIERKPLHVLKKELKDIRDELVVLKKDVLYNYKCVLEFVDMHKGSESVPYVNNKKNYRKASNNNWYSCKIIAHECVRYTSNFKKQLTADDNMPAAFADECLQLMNTFDTLHRLYAFKKFDVKRESFYKTNGGNTIYKHLTTMLRHAQLIYRHRPDMQLLFQFDKLLRNTKNAKSVAGKKLKVKPKSIFSKVAAMF